MSIIVQNGATTGAGAAPHRGPHQCDRWALGRGCPHFTEAHVAALKAAGQWPTTTTVRYLSGYLLIR